MKTLDIKRLNPEAMTIALQERVKLSETFNAMSQVFSKRERTRQQLVLNSMIAAFKKKGFSFTKQQYKDELAFLASIGIGTLIKGSKGQVRALKDIDITLQSIGRAALSNGSKLSRFEPSPSFSNLPQPKLYTPKAESTKNLSKTVKKATLSIILNGKTFIFDFVPDLDMSNVFHIITELCGKNAKGILRWTDQ